MYRETRSARVSFLRACLAVCALSLATVAERGEAATPSPEEEVKKLVVMIRSTMPSGDEEVGAGIIFGQQGSNLYVVTTNHVVRQGTQNGSVRVQLRWLPGEKLDAQLLEDADVAADWAVLKVPNVDLSGLPREGLPFALLADAGALRRGDNVYLLGSPTGHFWELTVKPDGVTSNAASVIYFESIHLEPGHSGGALLDDRLRVVGLLKSSQAPHGEAVNLLNVLNGLAGRGYPINLKLAKDAARATPSAPAPAAEATDPLSLLAAKGEEVASSDSLVAAIRDQEPAGPRRRGFDIGIAACGAQTLWGPGKQKILDSLSPTEQVGFQTAKVFALERNNNLELATKGAAIAEQDPVVAAARSREPAGLYWLGFDIASGIFGNPALGARGNTLPGPGSMGIRDKLSPAAQSGFNASMALHLSRNYRP